MINHNHPQYQKLEETAKTAINNLHIARDIIEQAAKLDVATAKALYPTWWELEIALQKIWGFDYDPNYIKTWYYPYCTCAKLDNDDSYPFGYYVVNGNCPIHGAASLRAAEQLSIHKAIQNTVKRRSDAGSDDNVSIQEAA